MIENLKPYPEYKNSGLMWLREVPAHWEIARSKRLFRQRKEFAQPDDQQLSATQAYGVIPQAIYEKRTGYRVVKISMHLDKRKHVEADDFVISMRSFQGGLERAWASGAIRSSYVVLEPNADVVPGFFQYLFKSHQYINALRGTSDFIRDGQDLNFGNFCGVDLPIIPLQEQAAIARYLAWATNRLDRAIGSKRRIIALLQEQKQSIIHRAVTRGLDPSVPLKDSGIPWLGEIPEHWEVRRTKQLCLAIIDCKNRTPELVEDGEFSVVRTTNIRNGEFNPRGSYSTDRRNFEIWTQRGAPKLGDVFFTREAPVGEACLVPDRIDLCMGQRMMYFRPDPDVLDAGFMLNSIYGPVVRKYIEIQVNGSTVGHLRLGQVSALPLLWCPVTEQKAIVAHIDKLSAPMATAISRLEQEITLLREYRTRLVADVVTGKLDVREVAAGLPEEIQSDDVQDATEEDLDLDAEDEVPENLA
jgi:type I restriction enzyme S subunit